MRQTLKLTEGIFPMPVLMVATYNEDGSVSIPEVLRPYMGMLAGTYTDPPALAYANASCSKEAPAVGYSTVYPLSMFLRIFTAQIVVLFFCGG